MALFHEMQKYLQNEGKKDREAFRGKKKCKKIMRLRVNQIRVSETSLLTFHRKIRDKRHTQFKSRKQDSGASRDDGVSYLLPARKRELLRLQ